MVDNMTETWFPQDMTTQRTVHAGQGDYEIVNLPRFKAHFTAYVGPNLDGSSTCVGIECEHLHLTADEAKACCERLRRRVERHPEQFPNVARALCSGDWYFVNPDAPEEGMDVHHDGPCSVHIEEPHEGTHTEPCGCVYVSVDVPDDQGYGQGWRPVEQCIQHAPKCPDDGRCWHLCGDGPCFRVLNCGPMSAYGDDWTDADKAAAESGGR